MGDKDSKLIFEAYSKNVLNEAGPLAGVAIDAAVKTGLAGLAIAAGYMGLTDLQKAIQNIDLNFLRKTAPAQASLLETMNSTAKSFADALESGDFNKIRTNGEQLALLYQDVPGVMNPLFATAGSIIIESLNDYENTEEDAYLAAATVAIGGGFINVVQQMIQSINGSAEIPDEAKQKAISILSPIVSEISATTSSAGQYLEEIKAEMAVSKAGAKAGTQRSKQQSTGSQSSKPQPPKRKPPKKRKGESWFKKTWKGIGQTKLKEQARYAAFPAMVLAGLGGATFAVAALYGTVKGASSIANIFTNLFKSGEDLSVTVKTTTGGIKDATIAADQTTRSTWSKWSAWLSSFGSDDESDAQQEEEPPTSTTGTGTGTKQDPISIKFEDFPNSSNLDKNKYVNREDPYVFQSSTDGKWYKIIE